MTPDQLLLLANFVGPSALESLTRNLFGRHWAAKLVSALKQYPDIATTRGQRRRLQKAMGTYGWDVLLDSLRGDPEPLRETVAVALGWDSRGHADAVAGVFEANFARSLSAQDFASVLELQLRDLQAAAARANDDRGGALSHQLGEADYARTIARAARFRRWRRREVLGLPRDQIAATFGFADRRLAELETLARGEIVFVTAAIGSGKSDIAFEWLARCAEQSVHDRAEPLPVLLRGDSIPGELETEVLRQVTASQLSKRGARIVVDGLDEANERAFGLAEQAVELVAKWPRSSIVVTSRLSSVPPGVDQIRVPEWPAEDADGLMAAVRHPREKPSQFSWTDDLRQSIRRPLFAILAALADDATNPYELVGNLVTRSLKRSTDTAHSALAIEIVRQGCAVDLRELQRVNESDLDTDRLVSQVAGRWQFELPIFLQWFAAQGVLSGGVSVSEYTVDLASFGRWRYVLAVALAGASPEKTDQILASVARWNPGAASLLIGEVTSAGLGDQSGAASSDQLTRRVAASLESLRLKQNDTANGWLAAGRSRVSAVVGAGGVGAVQWTSRLAGEGDIGTFIPHGLTGSRPWMTTLTQVRNFSTLSPWNWNLDQLSKQLEAALQAPHLLVDEGSIIREEFLHRAWVALGARSPIRSLMVDGRIPERINYNGLEIDQWSLEQLVNRPATWSRSGPWTPPDDNGPKSGWVGGNYSPEALVARVTEVYSAALGAYVELADGPFREFGDLLELRATLPARMVLRVTPANDYAPALAKYLLPLPDRESGILANTVEVAIAGRGDRIPSERELDEMEAAYIARRNSDPGSALMLRRSHSLSILEIFGPRPATDLAVKWLWSDLANLNRVGSPFRQLH